MLIDFFDWMPPYGENVSRLHVENDQAAIEIVYDGADGPERKLLSFAKVRYVSKGTFPGIGLIELAFPYKLDEFQSGCLFEIEDSELAGKWNRYSLENGIEPSDLKHYLIFLTDTSTVYHVVCGSVSLS